MTASSPIYSRHTWEQWDWVWHAIAGTLMVLNVLIAVNNDLRRASIQAVIVVSILLGVWYLPFLWLSFSNWIKLRNFIPLYLGLGWMIWLALVYMHPPAMMLAAFFYPQVFLRLPFRWALAGAVLLTGASYWAAFIVGGPTAALPAYLFYGGLLIATQIILSVFIYSLISQSNQRYKLLQELQLTRNELARVEREAGTMAERQRMAREIHDTLAQDFTSIIMHLTAAQLNEPSRQIIHLQQAEQTAREGLAEARRIVWAMRPGQLEHASFVESIEQLASRFSLNNSIAVKTTVTGLAVPLDPVIEAELFRITQEALQNIKKHSRAQNVKITLSYMHDLIALDILDDGIGFQQGRSA